MAHAMSLEEFAAGAAIETSVVRDYQARHFASMGSGGKGDSLLDAAKAALTLYHAVGVQEEFAMAVALVCECLDCPPPVSDPVRKCCFRFLSDRDDHEVNP